MAATRLKSCSSLLTALALLGCEATDARYERVIDGCGVPHACDIAERDCQLAVLEVTACARGERAPRLPKVRTITRGQYRDELEEALEDEGVQPGPWETALVLLGLHAPGVDASQTAIDERVANVGAFYNSRDGRITVIDDPTDDAIGRMYTLSHELAHYLQDNAYDLERFREDLPATFDSQLAASVLIEGDATVSSSYVYAWLQGWPSDELDWDSYYAEWFEESVADVAASEAPMMSRVRALAYSVGGAHIERVSLPRNHAAVEDLFARPYTAFTDWLGAFVSRSPLVDRAEDLDCAPPPAPAELKFYGSDSFGASGIIALLSRGGNWEPDVIVSMATALRNDMVVVYANSSDDDAPAAPVAVAWRLRFANAELAEAFLGLLRTALPNYPTAERFGQEVLLTGSSSDAVGFQATSRQACPDVSDVVGE